MESFKPLIAKVAAGATLTRSEAVKAICVLQPSKVATADEIINFVGGLIARYKRPKTVVFVDKLPNGATGDVDRAAVKSAHGQA